MEKLYFKNLRTGDIEYSNEILIKHEGTTLAIKGFTKYTLEALDEINDILARFGAPVRAFADLVDTFDEVVKVDEDGEKHTLNRAELKKFKKDKIIPTDGVYWGMTYSDFSLRRVATSSKDGWILQKRLAPAEVENTKN